MNDTQANTSHSRNTAGLCQNAQKKREKAFEKVNAGIQKLLEEKQKINFNTVAAAAGVSKAWLYKEPSVKAQVEELRDKTQPQQTKNSSLVELENKLKILEAENLELKQLLADNDSFVEQLNIDASHKLHKEHIDWLEQKKEIQIIKLEVLCKMSLRLPRLKEKIQKRISSANSNISYLNLVLDFLFLNS
jgi:predicted RNase H-like nuclease (RuvC/YqgF family)